MICIQEGKRDGRDIILVDITVLVIVVIIVITVIGIGIAIVIVIVVVVIVGGIVEYTKAITITVAITVGSLIWMTLSSLYRCILGKGWLE